MPDHPPLSAAIPPLPCYLNGHLTTLDRAQVSVLDRGFIFGDGVYEVVPVYAGQPFRLQHHLQRLGRSLREVRISNPFSDEKWREEISNLIAACGCYLRANAQNDQQNNSPSQDLKISEPDQLVYIQVTRGVAMRDHAMPEGVPPTVFMMSNRMKLPSAEARAQGVACVTAEDFRWHKGHIKSTSLLGAVFARQISADVGATETIMFRGQHLTEAAASNVWVVKDGRLIGSPKDNWVLEGIRYGLFGELCKQIGIDMELRRVRKDEVLAADELLLTSASKEVLPVTQLDGQAVGHASHRGRPGPIYTRLYAAYQDAKARSATA